MSSSYLDCIEKFIGEGIISMSDVVNNGEEDIVKQIISKVHPYTIYQANNSRWYTYVIVEGTRKKVSRSTQKDLEKYLIEFYGVNPKYTFERMYVEWMKFKQERVKSNTMKEYIKAYNRFYQNDEIVKKDLSKLTTEQLSDWLEKKIREHKLNYKAYLKMQVVLKGIYEFANMKGYFDNNPYDHVTVRNLRLYPTNKKRKNERVFTRKETQDIYKIAFDDFKTKPNAVPIAVLFTFQTGVRIGELVALKWSDINFKEKYMCVQRMEEPERDYSEDFQTLTDSKTTIYEETKGEYGIRYVDLSNDAIYLLNLLKDYYRENQIESEWLFTNADDKIHHRAVDLRIRKYCRHAGIPEKSTHRIRSSYISALRNAGVSFQKIQEQVGHKDLMTTVKHYLYDVKQEEENRKMINEGLNILTNDYKNDSDCILNV